jgi:Zinc-binding dehydrogenase
LIDSTLPLEREAEALKRMERGDHFGKIVIPI